MKAFQILLRIVASMALIGYMIFLADLTMYYAESDYSLLKIIFSSEYLLFLIFVVGYYLVWKNELISGLVIILWHGLQWCFILWVWEDAELTLVFGIPIAIIGILLVVYGILDKRSLKADT